MTATQAPTPGPLTSESVKLLVKGDLLRVICDTLIGEPGLRIPKGTVVEFEASEHGLVGVQGDFWSHHAFAFIGRPDKSGWMPWSGGENPVPGQMVERKERSGDLVWCACLSDDLRWSHSGWDTDIIAFRLAPTAPVEASGSERERLISVMRDHIALGEIGSCSAGIVGHEEAADAILALLSALPLALGGQQGVDEDWIRGMIGEAVVMNEDQERADEGDEELSRISDAVLKALRPYLSTTPARAEAQDEGAAGVRDRLVAALADALAFIDDMGTDLHHARVADWYPEGANNAAVQMSEDMRLAGNRCATYEPLVDLNEIGSSHPSPTPAADADRVRIAVEPVARVELTNGRWNIIWLGGNVPEGTLLYLQPAPDDLRKDAERYCFLRSRDPGPDGKLPSAGLFIGQVPENYILTERDADNAIDEALAALKSTAAKEGEEA